VNASDIVDDNHHVLIARSNAPFWRRDTARVGWSVYIGNGGQGNRTLYVELGDRATSSFLVWNGPFPLKKWAHVAFTFDSSSGAALLYVNGAQVLPRQAPPTSQEADR
jgi:hypothetical protein